MYTVYSISKALFDASTIRGWLDFEDGVYRDQHSHMYTASIMSLLVCMYIVCVYTYMHIVVDSVPCGKISRAVFIGMSWPKYAVRFRGNTVLYIMYTQLIIGGEITTSHAYAEIN